MFINHDYIYKIFSQVRGRPLYIVRETEESFYSVKRAE